MGSVSGDFIGIPPSLIRNEETVKGVYTPERAKQRDKLHADAEKVAQNFMGRILTREIDAQVTSQVTTLGSNALSQSASNVFAEPLTNVKAPSTTPTYPRIISTTMTSPIEAAGIISSRIEASIEEPAAPKAKFGIKPRTPVDTMQAVRRFPKPSKKGEWTVGRVNRDTGAIAYESYKYGAQLGKGGFAKVVEILETGKKAKVFKFPIKGGGEVAKRDVENDYTRNARITQDGDVWGIKPPPLFKASIARTGPKAAGTAREGYFDVKYDKGSLMTRLNEIAANGNSIAVDDAMPMLHQIFFAGAYMEENGYMDDDRKEDNILLLKDKDVLLVHFSDWGGVRFKSEIDNYPNIQAFHKGAHTRQSTALSDIRQLNNILNLDMKDDYIELEEKRLTFSLGLIAFSILTSGSKPYPIKQSGDSPGYLDTNIPQISITSIRSDLPPGLAPLIDSMLNPDYQQRPSPKIVMEKFNAILETLPDMKATILDNMAKLGYSTQQ